MSSLAIIFLQFNITSTADDDDDDVVGFWSALSSNFRRNFGTFQADRNLFVYLFSSSFDLATAVVAATAARRQHPSSSVSDCSDSGNERVETIIFGYVMISSSLAFLSAALLTAVDAKYLVTLWKDAMRGRCDRMGDGFREADCWPTGDAGGTDG